MFWPFCFSLLNAHYQSFLKYPVASEQPLLLKHAPENEHSSSSHHLSLNHEGRWGTKDDFATSFLYFSLFSIALWDLANSGPVHSLVLSSHLFLCLPCLEFFPLFLCLARWFWPDLMNGGHDHTAAVCVSLGWSDCLLEEGTELEVD